MKIPALLSLLTVLAATGFAEETWTPMFNGRDLDGWVNVNCAPQTWGVKEGVITCTGKPTGALRTARMYENFILEIEWRHLQSGGNSGVFVWGSPISAPGVPFLRGIEVQVLDEGYNVKGKNEWYTTHGDVFPIHGATMNPIGRSNGKRSFPSEERSKPSPEWNHYRIVAQAGSIRLSVNGKEVSGGDECVYRKGYLALESEGAPVEFRNARIQELPPTGATPEQTAPESLGHRSLYNGLDFTGWQPDAADHWAAQDWKFTGKTADATLQWAEDPGSDFELLVDCQWPKGTAPETVSPAILVGDTRIPIPVQAGKFVRAKITVRRGSATVSTDGAAPNTPAVSAKGKLTLHNGGAAGVTWANLLWRSLPVEP